MSENRKTGSGPRSRGRRGRGGSGGENRPNRSEPREREQSFREQDDWNDRDPADPDYEARGPRESFEDRGPAPVDPRDREYPEKTGGEDRRGPRSGRADAPEPRVGLSDEYQVQVCYDRAARVFVVTCTEFPAIRVERGSKDAAIAEMEEKLDEHVHELKRAGGRIPEPLIARRGSDILELKLSQSLIKKLDQTAKQERVTPEQLAIEFISAGMERRNEPARGNEKQPPQRGGNREGGGGKGNYGNRRNQAHRNFQHAMESRENFMEYVRNLEKGGGYPKKR